MKEFCHELHEFSRILDVEKIIRVIRVIRGDLNEGVFATNCTNFHEFEMSKK
jgi:hypothetical protein